MSRQISVVHMTSAHPRFDTRVFVKQCQSLARSGFVVHLVVADGLGDEFKGEVRIHDVGRPSGRINRVLNKARLVYKKARELNADLYHIHDPELMPFGLALKRGGFRVVFDSHEDVSVQILSKPYLYPLILRVMSSLYRKFERFACQRFDAIVTATPYIREKFRLVSNNVVDVNNYPVLGELDAGVSWDLKRDEVCYVGGLTEVRGIREIVCASASLKSKGRLNLGGRFSEINFESQVKSLDGWRFVNDMGYLDRDGVRDVLRRSVAGLVTLHPIPNYIDALPVKMFEYMAAGIPVIASDFPLWRNILSESNCGVCVDPLDVKAIAEAIDYFVVNREVAHAMGERGRLAVLKKYNWDAEFQKLLSLYRSVGVSVELGVIGEEVKGADSGLC